MSTAEVFRKIEAQQGKKHTRVWHVGEHLKEFLGKYPQYAELIAVDLDNPEMALAKFEAAIEAAARKNGGGLGGEDADAVLRKFYGLPAVGEDAPAPVGHSASGASPSGNAAPAAFHLNLSSFL